MNYRKEVSVMGLTDKLDKLMEQHNLNKNQLAKESGIPYTTIDGLYKKGADNVKLSTLRKLAAFFGCSLDYIADDAVIENDNSDEELNEYLDELHKRPEMKMLFKVAKKATKEDVEKAVKIIEMFKGNNSDDI